MATQVGLIEVFAKIDTSQYKSGEKEIEKSNSNIEKSADSTSTKSNSAFNSIAKVGLAAVAAAAVAVSVAITKNIGNAIDRIDTLVAFPRVLQALGSTSNEAENATKKLSESLRGLPTSLQAGASGVQGLVTAGLDVNKATDAFLGLNNALLVSGGGTAQAEAAMLQLQQALSRGRIEGQEWNTIASSMPTVLQALGNETGKTKDELREMFRTDPQGLIDNIIRLNKDGGGGLASLDTQAREATGGIGTAFDNMNNAITRGIESIVKSIGDGGTDQEKLASGQKKISDAITSVGNAFGTALAQVGPFINFIMRNQGVFGALASAIGVVVGAITLLYTGIKLVTIVQGIWNVVTGLFPGVWIALAIIGIVAAIIYLWNNVDGFRNFFIGAWEMIKNAAVAVFDWAKNNWPLIVGFLTGPIGIAVALIIKNFDKIKQAAQAVWNWITGAFSTIGEIGTSIVKGAVNSVLGFAERTINGFINMINGALDAINKIPGVNIGKIGTLSVPRLAEGGIVPATRGGVLANIGEGGEAEAVIPLSKLDKMINGTGGASIEVTQNIYNEVDMDRAMRDLAWRIAY